MNARVSRVTVAFGRADRDSDLLLTAASVAKDIGASLRVACFAVRPLDRGASEASIQRWRIWWSTSGPTTSKATSGRPSAPARRKPGVDFVVGQGGSWAEALADVSWSDGEVLAVGTSSSAISRFFLGSHASKIVRNSPVPVFLMPRTVPSR